MYFGGLTGSQHVTSDIVFLDLFSPYEMNYNPLRNQYEYILPSSSQLVNNSQSYTIYQLITNSITTLLPTSTSSSYCPITIRENL